MLLFIIEEEHHLWLSKFILDVKSGDFLLPTFHWNLTDLRVELVNY